MLAGGVRVRSIVTRVAVVDNYSTIGPVVVAMDDITVTRDVMVEMRDGVSLATDIYRPTNADNCPTIVHRNPYNKSSGGSVAGLMVNPLDAVQAGFAVIVQDARGRFKSEGDWVPFEHEADDGYDTIEWAAAQPWSNGKVGIYGSSYHGVTTTQAVAANPPSLEAAIAYLTGANYHDGWTYAGGAFELGFNLWWVMYLAADSTRKLDVPADARDEAFAELMALTADPEEAAWETPLRENPVFDHPAASYVQTWLEHPSYDDYWEAVDVTQHLDDVDIPVLHVTGWYDLFLRGHLDLYEALQSDAEPRAREEQRFIIGPWDHEAYTTTTPDRAGDRVFGYEAAGGRALMSDLTLNWFGHWLDDEAAPGLAPVRYYHMGENEWRDTDTWPPSHTPTEFYIESGGNANTRFGDGRLTQTAPTDPGVDSFEYDPRDPVPSCGGRSLHPNITEPGIQDRAALETRTDVLVYTSERLTSPLSIAGPVEATVFAASSAPDTDFTATVVDVEPDGYCAPIADGIIRARYRDGMDTPTFLQPGEVTEFHIDLRATAHTFQVGHRIRLEISSSDFPRYDRNPNVKAPVADVALEDAAIATQNIHHAPDNPSRLTLPVQ